MINFKEALKIHRHPSNTWPQSIDAFKEILKPYVPKKIDIQPGAKIFTIGSCFARNIEEHMFSLGYSVPCLDLDVSVPEYHGRPQGILNKYNPFSMLQEVDRSFRALASPCDEDLIARESLVEIAPGEWFDLELAGSLDRGSYEIIFNRRKKVQNIFKEAFSSDIVVLTLGLTESWYDELKRIHISDWAGAKAIRPYSENVKFINLSASQCIAALDKTCELLLGCGNRSKKIIITVSPVPLSDTFTQHDIVVANSYSKSTLRVAAAEIVDKYEACVYFPSYEMVMYSPRDMTWEADQRHVRSDFVRKIVAHLVENCLVVGE